jgi:hypothetical protein
LKEIYSRTVATSFKAVSVDFRGSSPEDDTIRLVRGWHEEVKVANNGVALDSQGSM